MAYVIINGKGLSGALHGGPGLAVRGGMQRGMRDGMGPTFPLTQDGMFREPAQYTQTNMGPVDGVDGIGGCPPGFIDDNGRCAPVTRLLSNGNRALSGPLKLTIEHLGGGRTMRPGQEHVRGGLRGLGDTGAISDNEARERIATLFTDTCSSWVALLNQALNDMPVFPVLAMQQTRSNLTARRDQINNQVVPAGLDVIGNQTIALQDVSQRIRDFMSGFLDVIKLDIHNAQQDAKHDSMLGQFNTFLAALQTVTIAAVKAAGGVLGAGLGAVQSALPEWVLPLAFVLGAAYVIHELK